MLKMCLKKLLKHMRFLVKTRLTRNVKKSKPQNQQENAHQHMQIPKAILTHPSEHFLMEMIHSVSNTVIQEHSNNLTNQKRIVLTTNLLIAKHGGEGEPLDPHFQLFT